MSKNAGSLRPFTPALLALGVFLGALSTSILLTVVIRTTHPKPATEEVSAEDGTAHFDRLPIPVRPPDTTQVKGAPLPNRGQVPVCTTAVEFAINVQKNRDALDRQSAYDAGVADARLADARMAGTPRSTGQLFGKIAGDVRQFLSTGPDTIGIINDLIAAAISGLGSILLLLISRLGRKRPRSPVDVALNYDTASETPSPVE